MTTTPSVRPCGKPYYFLALDLEFNQPSGNVLEVGICIGAPDQPPSDWIRKNWLVTPPEPLAQRITELTGITDELLAQEAVSPAQCCQELTKLVAQYEPFTNPVTWGAGDAPVLLDWFKQEGLDFPFFGRRSLDIKTVFTFLEICRDKSIRRGLSSAMGRLGLSFEGRQHRAATDAYNTLRLLFAMMDRQRKLETAASLLKTVA